MTARRHIAGGIAALVIGFGAAGHSQTATAPSNESFTVTDALGREVSFRRHPQRIAVAGKASFMIADAACLFPEARSALVLFSGGMGSRQGAGDFLSLLIPDLPETPGRSGDAGVEQIAAIQPDVVLLKSSAQRLGEALDRVHLPVVYLDFETPAQYGRDLATLGQLLGAGERASRLSAYYRTVTDLIEKRTATLPAAKKPRVLLVQYAERSGAIAFSVPARDWIQTEMVERAGGIPVWKATSGNGGWAVVNLEQIAVWDPDIVLVVNYRACANGAVGDILADAKWKELRATKAQRVFAFPGDFFSWDQPDTRWGLGMLWVATRLHPELFRETDLTQEVARFYSLYGLDEATIRTRINPLIQEDITHVRE